MIPEDIDLEALAHELSGMLGEPRPVGYLRGKSVMREALVRLKGFSDLEAEEVIDTLELQGFLHFLGDPADRSRADMPWKIER